MSASAMPAESRRELAGITYPLERRVLAWMAARVPGAIGPDHLTALGLLAFAGAGVAYALAPRSLAWLHVVNACLFLNWLGDSMDGTLARYRQRLRPRYGFYVDHVVDAFGALFVLAGLAVSHLMSPLLALALLASYLLLSVNIALAAATRGVFKISYGPFGGTELRIVLAVANLAVMAWPRVGVLGRSLLAFDVLAAAAILVVTVVTVRSAVQNTAFLYDLERLD
jgi:archaetidylinositol phosphate synthase